MGNVLEVSIFPIGYSFSSQDLVGTSLGQVSYMADTAMYFLKLCGGSEDHTQPLVLAQA